MEGWISLHRRILDASWFNKSEYTHLWIYLLLKANHKDKEIYVGNKKILIKRGQLLTSRSQLAKVVHIHESKIYRILKCFEDEQQIEQEKTKKYTVISILNYDIYQKVEQVGEQQMNSKKTADEHLVNTNNNDNNKDVIDINKYISKEDYVEKIDANKIISRYENMKARIRSRNE